MRSPLNEIEIFNWRGLATKPSVELLEDTQLRVAINCDHFTKYGAISKPPGSSRVLNSIYTEDGVAQPMSWVGFYKAPDLNGQVLRHVIVAGGTKLHRVDSGVLTALTGAGKPVTETRTSGLFHHATQFDDFLLIQNQDPALVGKGDTPVKYDGNDIHRWGLVAPGDKETEVDTFSDASSFTASGGTATDETVTTQDGTAVKFDKTSTGQVNGDLTKTVTSFAVDTTIANRAAVYLYIPRGQISSFSQGSTKAVQVFVGPNLTTDYYQFDFDRGSLAEGWNLLQLNFFGKLNNVAAAADEEDDPNVTIVGTPGDSGFTQIRLRVNSSSATQTISGVRWDRFVYYDKGALTADSATGAATDNVFKTGAEYRYVVTFVSKTGHESNGGPESATIETGAARDSIELTDIPTSDDPQVVARKLYRTVAGGQFTLFLDAINNNTDTTYTDTTGDLGLGQTSPPLEGDISDDNSPPRKAGIVKKWKRTVFIAGFPDRPNVVGYSEDDEPESFPTLNEVSLDARVTAMYETYSGFVIETDLGKWSVTGENPDFNFDKIISNIGCVGRRAAGEARVGGWAIDREGMRLYDLNNPVKISEVIRDKFDDDFDKSNIELLHSTHSKDRNAILMFVANSSGVYTGNNYLYQYPIDQLGAGWWWELQLPSTVDPLDVAEIEDSDGNFRLYFGGNDGMVYHLFDPNAKNWVRADGAPEAITTQFQTRWMRAGEVADNSPDRDALYSGRAQPRLIELRYTGDTPATWTVLVETANGSDQITPVGSQTVSFNFATEDETILRLPVPIIQPGEFMRITVTNSDIDVAGRITAVAVQYYLHPGKFPLASGDLRDTN